MTSHECFSVRPEQINIIMYVALYLLGCCWEQEISGHWLRLGAVCVSEDETLLSSRCCLVALPAAEDDA